MSLSHYPLSGAPISGSSTGQYPLLDTFTLSGCQTAASSYTVNITVGASGSNPALFATIAILTALGSVSSVSSDVDGALTQAVNSANLGIAESEIWSLEAPTAGAHVVTITLSGAISSDAAVSSWFNCDQSNPVDASNSATGTGGTPTVSVTPSTDNTVLLTHLASSNKSLTPTAPATLLTSEVCTPGEGATATEGPINPAAATSMAWGAVDVADVWAQTIVAIKPFVAAAPPSATAKFLSLLGVGS